MTETSFTFREPSLLSPRTANYVAALIREGDNFDYFKWLQRVREEEAQAKQSPRQRLPGKIIAAEIGTPISTSVTAMHRQTGPCTDDQTRRFQKARITSRT